MSGPVSGLVSARPATIPDAGIAGLVRSFRLQAIGAGDKWLSPVIPKEIAFYRSFLISRWI